MAVGKAQAELQGAIRMLQAGEVEAAAGILQRLLDGPELDDTARAAAYAWLAETRPERDYKIHCLQQAVECAPQNAQLRQALNQLLTARPELPDLPALQAKRPAPQLPETPRVVGIVGGLNGRASGIFVDNSVGGALLATTSYAIGSVRSLRLAIAGLPEMAGAVQRRYPAWDLALIEAPIRLARQPNAAPPALLAESQVIFALAYPGGRQRGDLAPVKRGLARQWLGTTFSLAQMPDAGGNPLYDGQGQLRGILTRNVDAAGGAYGLKLAHILALAAAYQRDFKLMPQTVYCPPCGGRAQAPLYGGRHCETCGALLPADERADNAPQPEKLRALYGENKSRPCGHCGARVGEYAGRCLRCGQTQANS